MRCPLQEPGALEEMAKYPVMPDLEGMAKIPRIEISDRALKVLKIEAALSGLPQKEALEAIILRGASSRTLALVEGKPVLEEMEVEPAIPVMAEKPVNPVMPEKEVKPIPADIPPEARAALSFILAELEAGNRPTISNVAAKLEITTTAISRMLNPLGVKAHNTHVAGKAARIYEPAMKARIREILSSP